MDMELAPRLNLVTGDNGLGKTLLLDCIWWALTQEWPDTGHGHGVVPVAVDASIEFHGNAGHAWVSPVYKYNHHLGDWLVSGFTPNRGNGESPPPILPPIVLFQRVDGGISVYDPLAKPKKIDGIGPHLVWSGAGSPQIATPLSKSGRVLQFREHNIWNGLAHEIGGPNVCEGLVRDLGKWASQRDRVCFDHIAAIVEELAGREQYQLTDKVEPVFTDDGRDFPVVDGPAGCFPIVHAPAGFRRILELAYLFVWAWNEHQRHAIVSKVPPANSIVLIVDEVESHLHPKW